MPSKKQSDATNEEKLDKDLSRLRKFIGIYCQGKHKAGEELCDECQDLFSYAVERRNLCPLDTKPSCKDCHIHCYKELYRERIRQVMRYAGKRFYKLIGS